jgi:nucleoside-diphosphate-sugar epimerase
MNVLVTGATGFVGRVICARLHAEGMNVRGTLLLMISQKRSGET